MVPRAGDRQEAVLCYIIGVCAICSVCCTFECPTKVRDSARIRTQMKYRLTWNFAHHHAPGSQSHAKCGKGHAHKIPYIHARQRRHYVSLYVMSRSYFARPGYMPGLRRMDDTISRPLSIMDEAMHVSNVSFVFCDAYRTGIAGAMTGEGKVNGIGGIL